MEIKDNRIHTLDQSSIEKSRFRLEQVFIFLKR